MQQISITTLADFTVFTVLAAELVVWSSSGDQYVLSYGALLVVHEVKVHTSPAQH